MQVLLTILKIDVSDDLRAAAARLLLCLHVDRDPQACTKVPLLTRTWAEVIKNATPKLPYVEPQRQYVYEALPVLPFFLSFFLSSYFYLTLLYSLFLCLAITRILTISLSLLSSLFSILPLLSPYPTLPYPL